MTAIRKSWWAALALAALVGCNQEEPSPASNEATPVVTPGPAPSKAPSETPAIPAPTTDKAATGKSDSTPAAALPAVEGPKVEAPKIDAPKVEPPKPLKDDDTDKVKKDDDKAAAEKLSDDELAEIKKLPEADQTLALKQIVCPVSEEHLGSMDKPLKVTAEGKTFFLCCKGCEKELNKDPKAVLAKLKN